MDAGGARATRTQTHTNQDTHDNINRRRKTNFPKNNTSLNVRRISRVNSGIKSPAEALEQLPETSRVLGLLL